MSYIKHHIDCIESKTGNCHPASPEAASYGIEAVLQEQRLMMTHVSESGDPCLNAPSNDVNLPQESRLPKDDALLCLDTR